MREVRGSGVAGATGRTHHEKRHPVLSPRWLRDAARANRIAFEVEMRRERRQALDQRFQAFLKEMSARQA